MKNVMQELIDYEKPGEKVRMIIRTDSDAAKGMIHRVGCGRVRYSATCHLWHERGSARWSALGLPCQREGQRRGLWHEVAEDGAMKCCMNQRSRTMSDIVAALRNQSSKGVSRDGPPGVVW